MYALIRKITQNKILKVLLSACLFFIPKQLLISLSKTAPFIFQKLYPALYKKTCDNMSGLLKPYLKPAEIDYNCRSYFSHLFLTLFEVLFFSRNLDKKIDTLIDCKGLQNIDLALQRGKGAILYASHTGNFFYYYYYLTRHYSALAVATALDKDLHEIYLIFQRLGCKSIDYDTTNKKEMYTAIKNHLDNNGILILFGDFYRPDFSPSVFWGRSTRTPGGAARLALNLEIPVIPFYGYRTIGLKHKIIFEKPEYLYKRFNKNQKSEAVKYLNDSLQGHIIMKPAQWFYWFNSHERWLN